MTKVIVKCKDDELYWLAEWEGHTCNINEAHIYDTEVDSEHLKWATDSTGDGWEIIPLNSKVVTIIRGICGSGKSTLAEAIVKSNYGVRIEADQFFINDDGEYVFDSKKLSHAHKDCQYRCSQHMTKGIPVVVSNTSVNFKEIKPYLDLAKLNGYKVQLIDVQGGWENVHNVPKEAIDRMKNKWENISYSQIENYILEG